MKALEEQARPRVIAVPNVSEGRDASSVRRFVAAVTGAGARVLDVHSDESHHRSVLTVAGESVALVSGMVRLAQAASHIDLSDHCGVHPRLGGLDVCPFVPAAGDIGEAVDVARRAGSAIADRTGLPVYLYGAAARRGRTRELPSLRRGGLAGLTQRAEEGWTPDFGPRTIDPARGVVCVGARGVLIAFNVWLDGSAETARRIAAAIRSSGEGGLPEVRALGLEMQSRTAQVSMNLINPDVTGIDRAFDAVAALARREGVAVLGTEIVGLPPERHMPDPGKEAARLLMRPGRSLETALEAS